MEAGEFKTAKDIFDGMLKKKTEATRRPPPIFGEAVKKVQPRNAFGLGLNSSTLQLGNRHNIDPHGLFAASSASSASSELQTTPTTPTTSTTKKRKFEKSYSLGGSRRRKNKYSKTKRRKHTYKYKKLTKKICKKKKKTKKCNHYKNK